MAAQAALIADTIAGMKRAVARRDDSSDSDDAILRPTNRGNKLKRRAKYVREGRLDLPNGPRVYKRKIDHAGYKRSILSRNPHLFDDFGDEILAEDADENAELAAAELNPYADIRLEYTLAPLTSAAELPNHPTLSLPYLTETLTDMAQQAEDMVHKEKTALWRMKHLLTDFRGDESWIPCGILESEQDASLFDLALRGMQQDPPAPMTQPSPQCLPTKTAGQTPDDGDGQRDTEIQGDGLPETKSVVEAMSSSTAKPSEAAESISEEVKDDDVAMKDADAPANASTENKQSLSTGAKVEPGMTEESNEPKTAPEAGAPSSNNGDTAMNSKEAPTEENNETLHDGASVEEETRIEAPSEAPAAAEDGQERTDEQGENGHENEKADGQDQEPPPAPHRMTTRAQAQAASDNTTTSRTRSPSPTESIPFIHPLFTLSASAHPDRDVGLPPSEADETRALLLMYVQKQEEVCRGSEKLYEGLLKANRLRKTVLKWTKAEAHVGEMSDGEDWYDKEEWGLDEDLKKGHEDEEDEGTTQGKKTRQRRV
ncbi:MAG: hypothetical protein M1817_001890 [Caeruleum heppii]|nr:MAG: hypothetical protein M1817_001890 [Caeruleum heppii]